ncbi:MAG: class C sortase [Ancrocorticia sp.]
MRQSTWSVYAFCFLALVALTLFLYPPGMQWWNSYINAKELAKMVQMVEAGPPERLQKILKAAEAYNEQLKIGARPDDYMEQLDPSGDGQIGRVKIASIDVDLPIYHTASHEVLRKGAGHMPETSLPVGGIGTHAAITAHRGLAESLLFTHLDKVGLEDTFSLEVAGRVLVYKVFDIKIVKPEESDWLKKDDSRDLVTLITCDPLGINTERMLVTGERIIPTPERDLEDANKKSNQPHFPWWLVEWLGGAALIVSFGRYLIVRDRRAAAAAEPAGSTWPGEPVSAASVPEK